MECQSFIGRGTPSCWRIDNFLPNVPRNCDFYWICSFALAWHSQIWKDSAIWSPGLFFYSAIFLPNCANCIVSPVWIHFRLTLVFWHRLTAWTVFKLRDTCKSCVLTLTNEDVAPKLLQTYVSRHILHENELSKLSNYLHSCSFMIPALISGCRPS